MSYEPTLAAVQPRTGGPALGVIFSGLPEAVAGLTVWRVNGTRRYPVRGAVRASVSGARGFIDPEAPFGIPSTFLAEMFDDAGSSLGFTGSSSKQLDSEKSWVHNPLDPSHAIPVKVLTKTGQAVAGQIPVNVYYPVGRAAGIAVTGQRRGIGNVPLALLGTTAADNAALDRMFGTVSGDLTLPPFLCVRLASRFTVPLPRPLFVAVPAPTQTPLNATARGTKVAWDVSGPEVDPPTPALAQTLLSRADLDAAYPTRKARDATYASRLALDTDYNLAGYSGVVAPIPVPEVPAPGGGSGGSTPTDNGDGTGSFDGTTDNGDGTGTYGTGTYGTGTYGA